MKKIRIKVLVIIAVIQLAVLVLSGIVLASRPLDEYTLSVEASEDLRSGTTAGHPMKFGSADYCFTYPEECAGMTVQILDGDRVNPLMEQEISFTLPRGGEYTQTVRFHGKAESVRAAIWCDDDSISGKASDITVSVKEGNHLMNEILCNVLFFFVLADFAVWRIIAGRDGNTEEIRKNKVCAILFFTALIVSLPLGINYLISFPGQDIEFHLMRIEGVKRALLSGNIPVRIDSFALGGQGYADPVFYPNLFLVFPALLRIVGFPVYRAYKVFIFVQNLACVVISYTCFKKIFRKDFDSIAAMLMFVFAPYRLICLYTRGALGEALAFVFTPLIVLAFYNLFSKELTGRKLKEGTAALIIGMTGIAQSHILSVEMVGIFMILACLLYIKRLFRPKVLIAVAVSVVAVLGLNMWFIGPFVSNLGLDLYVFSLTGGEPFTSALLPYQIFGFSDAFIGKDTTLASGIGAEMGLSLGIGATVVLATVVYKARTILKERNVPAISLCASAFVLGILATWMTSIYFPWAIVNRTPVISGILSKVQFPWRYLGIAALMAAVAAGALGSVIRSEKNQRIFLGIVAGVTVLTALAGFGRMMEANTFNTYFNEAGIDSYKAFLSAEYMYTGTSIDGVKEAFVSDEDYSVRDSEITYNIVNEGEEEMPVDTPFVFYPWYVAKDSESGERFAMSMTENGTVRFEVPPYYSGSVKVSVPESKKWIAFDALSVLSFFVICAGIVWETLRTRKSKKNMEKSNK